MKCHFFLCFEGGERPLQGPDYREHSRDPGLPVQRPEARVLLLREERARLRYPQSSAGGGRWGSAAHAVWMFHIKGSSCIWNSSSVNTFQMSFRSQGTNRKFDLGIMVLGDPHPTPVTSLVDQGVDDKTIDNVQRNVELPLWTPTGGALELEQR